MRMESTEKTSLGELGRLSGMFASLEAHSGCSIKDIMGKTE
jgi:hypothetical protein